MKFLRYCYGIDFDISDETCRPFGDGKVFGYVINNNIYLGVSGNPNLFCHFINNDNTELSDDSLCRWGANMTTFIKETVGTVVNLRLAIEVPTILHNLNYYEIGDVYDPNNILMHAVLSHPVVELKQADDSFFVTVDGESLYEKGIVNKKLAEDLFYKLSNDIGAYIKKRWPIK